MKDTSGINSTLGKKGFIFILHFYTNDSYRNPFHLEYMQAVIWQIVKTQIKCCIMQHFIRVCTICKDKNNIHNKEMHHNLESFTGDLLKYKMGNSILSNPSE